MNLIDDSFEKFLQIKIIINHLKNNKDEKKNIAFLGMFLISCSVFSQVKEKEIISKNSKGKAELINFIETKVNSDDKSVDAFLKKQYGSKNDVDFILDSKKNVTENKLASKKYQQLYKGLQVEFGVQNVVSENGNLKVISGRYIDISEINVIPKLTEKEALSFALKSIGAKSYMWENKSNEDFLKKEQNDSNATFYPKGELLVIERDIFGENPIPVLAYKFDIYALNPISRDYIYIDANNGDLLLNDPIMKDIQGIGNTRYSGQRPFETQQSGTQYKLRDYSRGSGIETYNMNKGTDYNSATDFIDNDNNWTSSEYNNINKDNAALDAHWGAEKTYDYFLLKHNRNSYNGSRAIIKNYVHFSNAYDNAYWDGQRMTYGDGGSLFSPLTSVDVVGHEIGHGVCSYTANLIYSNESGAINEGLSDIWGAMVEYFAEPTKQTYLIGEEIKLGGGAIRSMINPKSYSQPDTYKGTNWYLGTGDNGGVHTNSGIMNHWFYILSEGKSGTNDIGNSYVVTGIGKEKSAKIVYRAESVYFTATTNYLQASALTIQAANDLYGVNSLEALTVENAWYAVGVRNAPWVGVPSIDLQLVSDSNYVNLYLIGANSTDINSQKITSTTWVKIASTNGGNASGAGFEGFGSGPNFNWTATLKISATNSYGTTVITRDVTCAPPIPCNNITYSLTSTGINQFIINQIILPCQGFSGNEVTSTYDGELDVHIYDFQETEVLKTKNNNINLSALKPGIYIIKAIIGDQVLTSKILKQ